MIFDKAERLAHYTFLRQNCLETMVSLSKSLKWCKDKEKVVSDLRVMGDWSVYYKDKLKNYE